MLLKRIGLLDKSLGIEVLPTSIKDSQTSTELFKAMDLILMAQ